VLSAVAERATVTTLTNIEGRRLTEVSLRVRNHAKPYMKVELPAGVKLLSAEVEGQPVKPLDDPDGSRVPLLRAGLDSSKAYNVSFVYYNSGARFAKSGAYDMGLPKLDIPINLMTWEVSLPERLEVKQFGGNALSAELFPASVAKNIVDADDDALNGADKWSQIDLSTLEPGQVGGVVVDTTGAVVVGADVTVTNSQTGATFTTKSDDEGHWRIAGVQPGAVRVTISSPGFKIAQTDLNLQASKAATIGVTLQVGNISETVSIDGAAEINSRRIDEMAKKNQTAQLLMNSQNVLNLQRRVAGILPVAVEGPLSGKSYRFVRPLVMEEETRITFQYKSK
jgi:Carboxypeptidase regulatory-like domain